MNIRIATAADIPDMVKLDRQSATAGQWTETQYQRIFEPGEHSSPRMVLVVEEEQARSAPSPVLGFVVAHYVDPEWELENIVVAEAAQRKGLGGRLLGELFVRARETNSESVFLEVRESNQIARSFYRRWGFQETGRRKGYYRDPAEDAILYRCRLLPEAT
jgi:[ribosomal protein S18]-alanine N-acetyltransferase